MRRVGRIKELWRYPVSSVTGEQLDAVSVSASGMDGDRRYALVDAETGIVAHPERDRRWQKAVFVKSRMALSGGIEVQVPDHGWLSVGAPGLIVALAAFFEFSVEIRPYERSAAAGDAALFAVHRYDVSPLHLLTSASVDHLKSLHPAGNPDRRRFRPNIFVDTDSDITGFAELGWIDKSIRLGDLDGTVMAPTKRCGFTIIAQEGLENDPEILRNVMKFGARNMGVYCTPDANGLLKVGDSVQLG
ncbi:MOSC domain-containing protein [bacterium M00.F.Ca.ET.194.01.1.1]|nr:MOSC domain-containing protein [bacterium M00.F.Ca.ET.194.01.1.1]TGS52199.1 MOSC domain-containing protein [bacterium M00.F.Ca.ET.179.01.1.1]TGV43347.1 MOSC domain-containing protein [bacterium M00.F.Ca.ET.168.01.1.1]